MSIRDQTGFDPTAIFELRRLGGDQLVRLMVRNFLAEAPMRQAALHRAAEEGDFRELQLRGYFLKGNAGNLGLTVLAELGFSVEVYCSCQRSDLAVALLADLDRLFEEACACIRPLLAPSTLGVLDGSDP